MKTGNINKSVFIPGRVMSASSRCRRRAVPKYSGIEKLFKEEYNIELVNVSGYFVSMKDDQYIRGYNSVSQKAIQDKYGKDFFEKAYQEAKPEYSSTMSSL